MADSKKKTKSKKKDTKFQPGQSGNPNGRPKGSTNRALTLEQIQQYLAKGDKFAMDTILLIMGDDEATATTRLRAAVEWLGFDLKTREAILKRARDEYEFKTAEEIEAAKNMEQKDGEEDDIPSISLTAE